MTIEQYVGSKWSKNGKKHCEWNVVSQYMNNQVEKLLRDPVSSSVTGYTATSFLVQFVYTPNSLPKKFRVQLGANVCSCGYPNDMGAPCTQWLLRLHHENHLAEVHGWVSTTSAFADSCSSVNNV